MLSCGFRDQRLSFGMIYGSRPKNLFIIYKRPYQSIMSIQNSDLSDFVKTIMSLWCLLANGLGQFTSIKPNHAIH